MRNFTHEPPENPEEILQQLRLIIQKSKSINGKGDIEKILSSCNLLIDKTGSWSNNKYGFADAIGVITLSSELYDLITPTIKTTLISNLNTILLSTACGLQISDINFVPGNIISDIGSKLDKIISDNESIINTIDLPSDLINKGKEMSQLYLYLYVVENCLRLFIETVQSNNELVIPTDVKKTILKNKENEHQNKFIPLRGDSDLYYCDFVQLQQIISNNWDDFKKYFPHNDQHWLRVKIEDMYRVRNIIAHCGYVTQTEFQIVESNFQMILRQLNFVR